MKSSYFDGGESSNHTLCWKNGRWSYESSECRVGEMRWRQTLRACKLHREYRKDQSDEFRH